MAARTKATVAGAIVSAVADMLLMLLIGRRGSGASILVVEASPVDGAWGGRRHAVQHGQGAEGAHARASAPHAATCRRCPAGAMPCLLFSSPPHAGWDAERGFSRREEHVTHGTTSEPGWGRMPAAGLQQQLHAQRQARSRRLLMTTPFPPCAAPQALSPWVPPPPPPPPPSLPPLLCEQLVKRRCRASKTLRLVARLQLRFVVLPAWNKFAVPMNPSPKLNGCTHF